MRYVSTRGDAPVLGFSDVLLAGLARDGGLYVPETWPALDKEEIAALAGKSYAEVAFAIISRFTGGDIPDDKLRAMAEAAYGTFRHEAVAPLVQSGTNEYILELFHGPTLAFKDVAMQLLARMMDHVLAERNLRATIVGATSGDTGGAAIEAFRGRDAIDIVILHPKGRVSPVQRRQMTTVLDENVHNIALRGTFDDCQAHVKAMFNHFAFRDQVKLTGVNSINWARIVAQVVYYFTAAVSLGAPHRPVSFTVPTGNFGDIFAGYVAKKMGLPIEKLIIATNINDILKRTLDTGRYEVTGVEPTASPSMDIQVSSNFERLLFELCDRDGAAVKQMMASLQQSGAFSLPETVLARLRAEFAAERTDEAETKALIASVAKQSDYVIDPHTAVGLGAARKHATGATPMIVLSTAHPAKFPAAVEAATGEHPDLPGWMADLYERDERVHNVENDLELVENFVLERARAARESGAI